MLREFISFTQMMQMAQMVVVKEYLWNRISVIKAIFSVSMVRSSWDGTEVNPVPRNIHSPAGHTICAIVNNLVDISKVVLEKRLTK